MQKRHLKLLINQALREDAAFTDITSRSLLDSQTMGEATIIAQEDAVLCGLKVIPFVFKKLDPKVRIIFHSKEGQKVKKGKRVMTVKGKTRTILSAERIALNLLGYLSGVATQTAAFVQAVRPLKVKIMDTRKTLPGMRPLVRQAVRCGGGVNHRFDLKEMAMVKDNHLCALKELSIPEVIARIRKKTSRPIEVEVDTLNQFHTALSAAPDIILLDNMSVSQLKKAVQLNRKNKKCCQLEASGGITLKNIKKIAQTGVDRVSVGALTHSVKSTDFSLELK